MAYLIGTDEAGYGPNLGPLVVGATVWQVPQGVSSADLAARLSGCITHDLAGVADGSGCVPMGDSKVLYQAGKGLRHLECGVWAALAALGHSPRSWREAWDLLAPGCAAQGQPEAWYADYDQAVPVDADFAALAPLTAGFVDGLCQAQVRLVAIRARAVFPAEFNRLCAAYDSKGEALSQITLGLAAEMIRGLPDGPIHVVCDKHGGRNQYHRLLAEQFPDWLIEIRGESRSCSTYRFGPAQRRIEFRFQVGGESHLPTALASMVAKYLRELAMRAWNDFWCGRVDGLKPTAGYPGDARRFKDAIAAVQRELGIADAVIWRER